MVRLLFSGFKPIIPKDHGMIEDIERIKIPHTGDTESLGVC